MLQLKPIPYNKWTDEMHSFAKAIEKNGTTNQLFNIPDTILYHIEYNSEWGDYVVTFFENIFQPTGILKLINFDTTINEEETERMHNG